MKFKVFAFISVGFTIFFASGLANSEALESFDAYIENDEAVFKCLPTKESIDNKLPWLQACAEKIERFVIRTENDNCVFVEKVKENGLASLKEMASSSTFRPEVMTFHSFDYRLPIERCDNSET